MSELPAQLSEDLLKCSRCGQCRYVCPSFMATGSESDVARGRIFMIRAAVEGEVEANRELQEFLSRCLVCKSCVLECPSGVEFDRIIKRAREVLVEKNGLPWVKKMVVSNVLPKPSLLDPLSAIGSFFESLLFKKVGSSGMKAGFSIPFLPKGRVVPRLRKKSFRNATAERIPAKGEKKGTVAYFVGCMTNWFYPEIASAVVNVLTASGIEVIVPKGQVCCGEPASVNGDRKTVEKAMAENLKAFGQYEFDALVMDCPTCESAFLETYPGIEGPLREEAVALARKVKDFSVYVAENLGIDYGGGDPLKVTYHDPCHHYKGQKLSKEPRQVIKGMPGVELREMKHPEYCCGFGGSFSLDHYDLSKKINDSKIEDIAGTGCDAVVTSCPGCIMQLADGVERHGLNRPVLHLAQLVEARMAEKAEDERIKKAL